MSDQERDKVFKAEEDDGSDEVEAHRNTGRGADATDDDGGDDVEAHKLQGSRRKRRFGRRRRGAQARRQVRLFPYLSG